MINGSLRAFARAFAAEWFTAMSGALAVPLTITAILTTSRWQRLGLLVTAIACLLYSSYKVWHSEYLRAEEATLKARRVENLRPILELIFDPLSDKFVKDEKYPFDENILIARRWYVGVRNASRFQSADDLTVRAKPSWFVECSIAVAHRHIGSIEEKEPIILKKATLEPLALEYVELFGLDPKVSVDVFNRSHEIILEARARDAPTVQMTLCYEPGDPPIISRKI